MEGGEIMVQKTASGQKYDATRQQSYWWQALLNGHLKRLDSPNDVASAHKKAPRTDWYAGLFN
jgi:hypothetical protein